MIVASSVFPNTVCAVQPLLFKKDSFKRDTAESHISEAPNASGVTSVESNVNLPRQPQSPMEWLIKMSETFKSLNYRGIFTFERGRQLDSLKIVHRVKEGVESERLYHLNGALREIVRQDHQVHCIHPGDQIIRLEQTTNTNPFASASLKNITALTEHYWLSLEEGARIADRSAIKLVVKPQDSYRYGYVLWLDQATGILLKSLLMSAENRVLERFQFVQIDVNVSISDAELQPQNDSAYQADHHSFSNINSKLDYIGSRVQVGWVPEGFTQAASSDQPAVGGVADKTTASKSLMYTDGLATFSIFVDLLSNESASGFTQNGGTIAYAKSFTDVSNDRVKYLVTIVGEVPMKTAERVANAIQVNL